MTPEQNRNGFPVEIKELNVRKEITKMSESENKALKRATVKCHGKFKTNLKVNAGKDEVVIEFIANQDTVDLNVLGRMLKDGATAIFVSDQTELPVDDDKDKGKEAPGQMSLLKGSGN